MDIIDHPKGMKLMEKISSENKRYRANFLWPNTSGSVEDAGYEFVNAKTEEGRLMWWKELLLRIDNKTWAAKKVEGK